MIAFNKKLLLRGKLPFPFRVDLLIVMFSGLGKSCQGFEGMII